MTSAPRIASGDGNPYGLDINAYGRGKRLLVGVFVAVPFLALIACIPLAIHFGLFHWHSLPLLALFYFITTAGVGTGFHRYFTHDSFKAKRGLKITMGIAGSMSIEGPLITWVADHKRHHEFSDGDGDPHSPWRFGTSPWAVFKGLLFAHIGWLFRKDRSDPDVYAKKLSKDHDAIWISRQFPLFVAISLIAPAVLGGLLSWSWEGIVSGFLWGSLVRVCLMHHVTWSTNSICHVFGSRDFARANTSDKSSNVWWLAIPSFGEAWHNWHHVDQTSARHGVGRGQIDINAWLIGMFEKFGWAYSVRWPKAEKLEMYRVS